MTDPTPCNICPIHLNRAEKAEAALAAVRAELAKEKERANAEEGARLKNGEAFVLAFDRAEELNDKVRRLLTEMDVIQQQAKTVFQSRNSPKEKMQTFAGRIMEIARAALEKDG